MLIFICKGGTGHRKCQDGICDVQKGTSDNVKADVVEKDKGKGKIMDVKKYLDDKVDAYDPTKMYDEANRLYSFSKVEGKDKNQCKCDCGKSSTCEVEPLKSEKKDGESIDNPKGALSIIYNTSSYHIFRLNGQVTRFKDVMEGIEAIPYGTLDKVEIFCPERGNNGALHTPYCADELVPFFNEVYRLLRHGGCFKATSTPRQMNGIAYIFEAMKLKILEKKYEGGEFTISGIKVNRYDDDDEGY